MALPKLSNDRPIYEMVVPSTKEAVKFRPFLVKEQKSLLVAFESQDQKQILNSMLVCIESCVPGVDIKKLATFDVDYMFTQVRSKSVGETSKVLSACTSCNEENEVTINLADIVVESDGLKTEVIEINDDISIEMKYPTYEDTLSFTQSEATSSSTEILFNSIASCLNSVQTKEENILIKHESREEIETFINSLTTAQLDKVTQFINKIPTLIHEQKYTCKKCSHENTLSMKGLQDFF